MIEDKKNLKVIYGNQNLQSSADFEDKEMEKFLDDISNNTPNSDQFKEREVNE